MTLPSRRCTLPNRRLAQGVTMLEVLVTLFIITLFLLASAGVQSSAIKLNKAAQLRTEAVLLATDLGERIEANGVEAATGSYACDSCALDTGSDACIGAQCNPQALRAFDLAEWGKRVGDKLPGASVSIIWCTASNPPTCPNAAPPNYYMITINWTDRRVNTTYADSLTGNTESFKYTMTKTVFVDPS